MNPIKIVALIIALSTFCDAAVSNIIHKKSLRGNSNKVKDRQLKPDCSKLNNNNPHCSGNAEAAVIVTTGPTTSPSSSPTSSPSSSPTSSSTAFCSVENLSQKSCKVGVGIQECSFDAGYCNGNLMTGGCNCGEGQDGIEEWFCYLPGCAPDTTSTAATKPAPDTTSTAAAEP